MNLKGLGKMGIDKMMVRYKDKDPKVNLVLVDLVNKINKILDYLNDNDIDHPDQYVKVGSGGTPDYLSSTYFQRDSSNHITLITSLTTSYSRRELWFMGG